MLHPYDPAVKECALYSALFDYLEHCASMHPSDPRYAEARALVAARLQTVTEQSLLCGDTYDERRLMQPALASMYKALLDTIDAIEER